MRISITAPGAPPIELAARHDRTITLSWSVGNSVPLVMDSTLCRVLADHLHDLADTFDVDTSPAVTSTDDN